MLRRVSLLLVPVAGLAIGGLLACDNQPSTSPGLRTPTSPGTPLTRLEISGPISVAPGATVQLTATAHRGDGSSQDVTTDALWFSSNTRLLSVSAGGRATGHQIGEVMVSANFGGGRGTRETIVVPRDTFRIVGVVTENEPPLSPVVGATVAVASGVGAGLTTNTGDDGRYKLYGLAGDVELQISKNGYHTHVQQYRADDHAILNAQLRLVNARRDLSGTYTLTVAAADDCLGLPELLRVRNYTAIVTMTGKQIDVRLEGATFAISKGGMGNRFRGLSEPNELVFTLTPYNADGYFYYKQSYGDLVEQLTDSSYLIVSGRASAVESTAGFAGTLNGAMTVYSGTLDFYPKTVMECRSSSHRITFRR